MTTDAPWMGTVPSPPDISCTGMLSCPAALHVINCVKVEDAVRRKDREQMCSNQGHEFDFIANGLGDLLRVSCTRCPKTYVVTER